MNEQSGPSTAGPAPVRPARSTAGPAPAPPPAGPDAGRTALGLCSVTYRRLPAIEVARCAAHAGLEVIEWGADVHAPAEEPGTVRAVREASDRYGLACCSYGSYFRATPDELAGFPAVARAAMLLGAERVRVWAGATGSQYALPEQRHATVRCLRAAALIAADHGLGLATEFHGGTLTDTVASTVRLLDEVDADNVRTYWQPPLDTPDEEALSGLAELGDRIAAVHAFSWWPGNTRQPLEDREDLWTAALGMLDGRGIEALLEFVPGDDPAVLTREAATLRRAAGQTVSGRT
ncbi:TIM barrel protein [Streptomyces sp. P01-B04]|uniref:sugar phosphate isomerase/epimerase family protein n=1 Tax=Streptomyces poriferorum TaxID=2798799 RepID=UPI001C6076EF|nr:TIM barrel protein [Streptomyces poriferorum]MBW5251929.1 TIM barrel protein [Streptomyces poriferorum]MBW5257955.1 TIM barrel protein [Streptomyces poriferorum]